ncbi:MAG TPA: non-homologous end-joining DNA ligase [Candidatus Limnocylindrales bacterium]|nr:non-homologous end-joining DNA ligase [Candidatus Limnocylindrales bacterium]
MTTKKLGRRTVELSNENKVLFPDDGITKGDIIAYYENVADRILPFLKGRPLVLERFPNGIGASGFYQKQTGAYFPDWIRTVRVRKQGGSQDLVVCDDVATLVYLANQAAITLHPWLSCADRIDCPDLFIVDLDPPAGKFDQARSAALQCRALLDELSMPAFLKTTGSKGLHVVVPLAGKESFDTVRAVATRLMAVLAARHPDELTTEHRIDKRRGRVYLDIARNAYAQTAVAAYSVRAVPGAPVSMPIDWKELAQKKFDARSYTIRNALQRRGADPWADLRRRRCTMSTLQKKLDRLEH